MRWFSAAEPDIQLLLLLIAGVPAIATMFLQLLVVPLAVGFEVRAASRRRREVPTLWDTWPTVSVIVVAHNASATIENCIRSIGLTRYARYELVLVDDGSTDNTGETMASAAAADLRIKVLRQPHQGRAAALNLGVRHATGDVVMVVGADTVLSRWTVDHMLQGFEDPRTGAVCGEGRPARWQQGGLLATISRQGAALTRRALTGLLGLPFPPCGIEAVTSKILSELGPFQDAAAGAELELLWGVHKAGYRIAFEPLARVHTASPSTLPALWRQRSHRARGLLRAVVAPRGRTGTSWQGVVLRTERLAPFFPVYSVFTALSMLAGVLRHVCGLVERRRQPGRAGAGATDRHDDARRELQDAWA
ncbi:cellulose synthase/poly-beta-1,6-N-acetylglucosamine synthase-like glycosyltransferase [Arthrobacter sp. B3I9]|uniref:glycosyltransferase n=1 Tax=Arthrobacter sp. B3I9 TaxID=3042270 RepID=UPI0027923B56|nr:glycosyltransferase family 2 protein [Arthrobacter sp. B3I9]MDQ0848607.1 cellulose synthase/poly-beta-1,6-N-acetylglucosamine synthase-like glycosyltransferase [Arthrobacter sp. B3I9]